MTATEPNTSPRDTIGGVSNQRLAADPEASVWVSANAGTGKTHVLINRISRLLLAGVRPERILCLTFTKAAAAEMSNRLNKRLAEWARADDSALTGSLRDLTGSDKTPEELAAARRLFAQVLDAPGGLNVRTIHSFCESLLGRFPLEAQVSPHFDVLDERTAAELLEEARDRLLFATLKPGGEATAGALKMLAGLVSEDGFVNLKKELSFKRGLFSEQRLRAQGTDALIDVAYRALGLEAGETAAQVCAAAADEDVFDGETLRAAAEALAGGLKTDKTLSGGIAPWLAADTPGRAATFASDYAPCFLTQKGEPRKKLMTQKIADANPALLNALLEEQHRVWEMATRLATIADAEATAALLRFGCGLLDEYETLKQNRALLDYDDLILKTTALLQTDGGVSWVHYKLDGGVDHILVDEAQDTSPDQWTVIRRLADDFYSGNGAREPGERTIFAVGDEKQSIYSFQGADPEGFREMSTYFGSRVKQAECQWREVPLTVSFRSVPDVLKIVDRVFDSPVAADGVRTGEELLIHHPHRSGHGGLVEIWPTIKPPERPRETAWDDPVDQVGEDAPEVVLAERIAATIQRWLEDGEILASAGRPIRADDIMILVRRRGIFAEAMIRALKARGVAVAGADRMSLIDQLAVMDLVALGRFALLPEDDLTLAEVLKGPLIGFDDDDLYDLAYDRPGTLWQSLKAAARSDPKYQVAVDYLGDILGRADFAPPFEFFIHVLAVRGGRKAILGRLGTEAADPIDEFLNLALDFERTHTPSLQGFLHWVEAGETVIKRDLEIDREEVRVLTVHGSKGLQANVIFLPDTCSEPGTAQENRILWSEHAPLWQPEKRDDPEICKTLREALRRRTEQEYRRLLYVAMTRARDRLYVCGYETMKGRSDNCWYNLIAAAFERIDGPQDIPVAGFEEPGRQIQSEQSAETVDERAGQAPPPSAAPPPDWATTPPSPEPDPVQPLTPSRPLEDDPAVRSPFDGDGGERFKRGALIHRLLESLPGLPPEHRKSATLGYLVRPVHGLTPAQQDEIATETLAVLDDPEFAPLFGPDSQAEVPLSGRIAGRIVAARIDRLVIGTATITIIDYKTNRPPPIDAADVSPAYLAQMAIYRALLAQIYPDHTITCVLAWTDGPRLMSLPNSLLDEHISQLQQAP